MKPMKPLKKSVGITLDSDIVEKIRQLADNDSRPLSQYINIVLRAHIAELESKKK